MEKFCKLADEPLPEVRKRWRDMRTLIQSNPNELVVVTGLTEAVKFLQKRWGEAIDVAVKSKASVDQLLAIKHPTEAFFRSAEYLDKTSDYWTLLDFAIDRSNGYPNGAIIQKLLLLGAVSVHFAKIKTKFEHIGLLNKIVADSHVESFLMFNFTKMEDMHANLLGRTVDLVLEIGLVQDVLLQLKLPHDDSVSLEKVPNIEWKVDSPGRAFKLKLLHCDENRAELVSWEINVDKAAAKLVLEERTEKSMKLTRPEAKLSFSVTKPEKNSKNPNYVKWTKKDLPLRISASTPKDLSLDVREQIATESPKAKTMEKADTEKEKKTLMGYLKKDKKEEKHEAAVVEGKDKKGFVEGAKEKVKKVLGSKEEGEGIRKQREASGEVGNEASNGGGIDNLGWKGAMRDNFIGTKNDIVESLENMLSGSKDAKKRRDSVSGNLASVETLAASTGGEDLSTGQNKLLRGGKNSNSSVIAVCGEENNAASVELIPEINDCANEEINRIDMAVSDVDKSDQVHSATSEGGRKKKGIRGVFTGSKEMVIEMKAKLTGSNEERPSKIHRNSVAPIGEETTTASIGERDGNSTSTGLKFASGGREGMENPYVSPAQSGASEAIVGQNEKSETQHLLQEPDALSGMRENVRNENGAFEPRAVGTPGQAGNQAMSSSIVHNGPKSSQAFAEAGTLSSEIDSSADGVADEPTEESDVEPVGETPPAEQLPFALSPDIGQSVTHANSKPHRKKSRTQLAFDAAKKSGTAALQHVTGGKSKKEDKKAKSKEKSAIVINDYAKEVSDAILSGKERDAIASNGSYHLASIESSETSNRSAVKSIPTRPAKPKHSNRIRVFSSSEEGPVRPNAAMSSRVESEEEQQRRYRNAFAQSFIYECMVREGTCGPDSIAAGLNYCADCYKTSGRQVAAEITPDFDYDNPQKSKWWNDADLMTFANKASACVLCFDYEQANLEHLIQAFFPAGKENQKNLPQIFLLHVGLHFQLCLPVELSREEMDKIGILEKKSSMKAFLEGLV